MGGCPNCGLSNPPDARFCSGCGTRLAPVAPAQEQRKTVTVLFADVTGSTQLGEQLDPESLRRVLARFFEAARTVVERHGGTVEKFIGDAVMAVFGVPQLHEDDALRAVRAAADLDATLVSLNDELRRDFGTELRLRIGVNTGEVVTGTQERLATGDAVNVAARLQQLAAPGQILLGEPTVQLVRAAQVEELEPTELRGKARPVRVFRLLDVSGASAARRMDTPMVGRSGQLRLLSEAFDHVVRERACSLFTLLGTAGVGKSRLAAEFLNSVEASVVRGRCLSYGEGITYWPVVEMVKQVSNDELAAFIQGLDGVRGPIAALLGDDRVPTSSADIAWAVRKLYEHVADRTPLVVVFDDLHWAEPTLLDLIEHVTDLSRDAPILLLCLARPELLDRRPGWGGGKFNATTVLLEPLTATETEQLIGRLVPGIRAELREKVRDSAAGNPLFIEEMLALVEAGDGPVSVPPTIQALLAARLDQLAPAERRVLESGSVEGKSFHRGAVQALDPDEPAVPTHLVGLVRKDLLRPDRPILPGEDAFRFRHLLIRDAAYDGLPKSARAGLHERFARWLDDRGVDLVERDEIVGYHLEQAYRYRTELGPADDRARTLAQEASDRLSAAGRRSHLRGDPAAAASLLQRALRLRPSGQPDVTLELAYGDALWESGRLAEATQHSDEAISRAAVAGLHAGELQLRLQRAVMLLHTEPEGRLEELRDLVERARPVLEQSGSDSAMARLWEAATHVAHFDMQTTAQLEAALTARDFARRASDLTRESFGTAMAAAAVVHGTTPVADGLAWLEREIADAPVPTPFLLADQGYLLALAGEVDKGRTVIQQGVRMCQERGLTLLSAIMAQQTWHIEMIAGDPTAAERVGRAGCEQLERMAERSFLSTQAAQLALSLHALGRYEEARSWADRGAELAATDDVYTQVLVRQVWMKLAARSGDNDEARRRVDETLSLLARFDDPVLAGDATVDMAEVLASGGDSAGAATLLRQAADLYRRKGATALVAVAERLLKSAVRLADGA